MLTLWDLIKPILPKPQRRPPKAAPVHRAAKARQPAHRPMQELYDEVTRAMLAHYHVRVRRWRTSMSGIAWEVRYHNGSTARLIEAPRPKGPMSAAIFLHEIGHHAIGFDRYKPRCLEEYHAWMFALAEMERHGLAITEGVQKRVRDSLRYAVRKARRRGLRLLPAELAGYV